MQAKQPPFLPRPAGALALVLLSFVLQNALGVGVVLWFPDLYYHNTYAFMILLQGASMLLPALLYYRFRRGFFSATRHAPVGIGQGVAVVVAAGVGLVALSALAQLWGLLLNRIGVAGAESVLPSPSNSGQLVLALFAVGLFPAIGEELLFRGILLHNLEFRNTRLAVLLSGLLFGLMHGQLSALPVHLLLGVVLGILAVTTGSIWVPVIYHLAHNGLTLLLMAGIGDQPQATDLSINYPQVITLTSRTLVLLALWAALLYTVMRLSVRRGIVPEQYAHHAKLGAWGWGLLILLLGLLIWVYFYTMHPI